jgi:HEAT repeat protein
MDSLSALLKHLADVSQMLSVSKLYLLSGLDKPDVERVRAAWPTIESDRRRAIVNHLDDLTESNFEADFGPIFRIGLADPEPAVRIAAIDGLWIEDDVTLIRPLIDMLQNDESEDVRATAAGSLARFVLAGELEEIPASQAEAVVEALRDVIDDEVETVEVRRRAIESIGYSSAEDVPDRIDAAYEDEDERMQISAVFAMGRSADARWADVALAEADSANPEMRYEAARACGELQNVEAIPALKRLLDDPDDQVREAAVWALGQVGGSEARRLLVAILEDEDSADLHEIAETALDELEFLSGDPLDLSLLEFDDGSDEDDDTDTDD